jgi:hypothetical protein
VTQEVYVEPLAPEFRLTRHWVFWEHYDPAPGSTYKKKTTAASWAASGIKLAWFHDIITFWQLWQGLPFSSLERYFYNKDSITVPVYTTGTADQPEKSRISAFSLFEKDIEPSWEDKINKHGSELQFMLNLSG